MTDSEFFALVQEQWFWEVCETELSKKVAATQVNNEIFDLEDVPF